MLVYVLTWLSLNTLVVHSDNPCQWMNVNWTPIDDGGGGNLTVSCYPDGSVDGQCVRYHAESANESTRFILDLSRCSAASPFPTEMFVNASRLLRLDVVGPPKLADDAGGLHAGTFRGLDRLTELRIEGFEWAKSVDGELFRPLSSLRRLIIVNFGQQFLTWAQLGELLGGLASTPLKHLTLDAVHGIAHKEKMLDMSIFDIANVSLESLVLVNNDFNSFDKRPSKIGSLRSLRYAEFSVYWLTFSGMNFGLDTAMCLSQLEELQHSFIYSVPPPVGGKPEITDILTIIDIDLIFMSPQANASDNCIVNLQVPLSRNLRRLIVHRMDIYRPIWNKNFCVVPDNNLEYIDMSTSPLPYLPRSLIGLNRIKHLDLTDIRLEFISPVFFSRMPTLEVVRLGRNPGIADDFGSDWIVDIFRGLVRLNELDLSGCNITRFPKLIFAGLESLVRLMLADNELDSSLDIIIDRCSQLRLIDLRWNNIDRLTKNMTDQLDSLQAAAAADTLVVDLTENPLGCRCAGIDFVQWMQTTRVKLNGFDSYTCIHVSGVQVPVTSVNVTELASDCSIIASVANQSTCPCDRSVLDRLTHVAASLNDYVCHYPTSRSTIVRLPVAIALATNATGMPPWCDAGGPWYRAATFYVPFTVVLVVVIVASVVTIVLLVRRYRKSERVEWYIATAMGFLRRRRQSTRPPSTPESSSTVSTSSSTSTSSPPPTSSPPSSDSEFDSDVFVFYLDDEHDWTRSEVIDVLRTKRRRRTVRTWLDFQPGVLILNEMLTSIERSRAIVFVISDAFLVDGWCREALVRAYTSRPEAVVPIVVGRRSASAVAPVVGAATDADVLLANVIRTNCPMFVAAGCDGDSRNRFQSELCQRVDYVGGVCVDKPRYERVFC